jgi:hypothetical protein
MTKPSSYPSQASVIVDIPAGASLLNFAMPDPLADDQASELQSVAALSETPYSVPFGGTACGMLSKELCGSVPWSSDKCFWNKVNGPAQCSLDWCEIFTPEMLEHADPFSKSSCMCDETSCQHWEHQASKLLDKIPQTHLPLEALPYPFP